MKNRLFVVLIFLLIVFGCSPKVRLTVLVPPVAEISAKRLAVLDFEGNDGKRFSSYLEAELKKVYIDEKPYFTLVERSEIKRILDEKRFSLYGLTKSEVIKAGNLIGADAVFFGLADNKISKTSFDKEVIECVKFNKKGKCLEYRKVVKKCVKKTVYYDVDLKLVQVTDAKILYADALSADADYELCEGEKPLYTVKDLVDSVRERVAKSIRLAIAPYYVNEFVEIMDDVDDLEKGDKKRFEIAVEFAKSGRLDRACKIWNSLIEKYKSVSLFYDVGVCFEAKGDLVKAFDYYNKADEMLEEPDDRINLALKRVKRKLSYKKRLKKILN